MRRPAPQDPLCPHKLPIDDCPWCAPARVVQEAPPHILADLGAEEVRFPGEGFLSCDGKIRVTGYTIPTGPAGTDDPDAHV